MANFGGHILTRAGQNLLAKLAATGGTLSYSSIKFGDGVLGSTLPTELAALISVKESVEPSRIVQRTADGRWNITGVLDNSKITTGFYLREWGVFSRDPNTSAEVLLLYANAGSTAEYIPAYAGGDTTTYIEKEMTAACVVSGGITVNTEISSELYIPQREKGKPNGVVGTDSYNKANHEQISRRKINFTQSKTLELSDAGCLLNFVGTADVVLTIPNKDNVAFPLFTEIEVCRNYAPNVTFAFESGATIQSVNGALRIPDRYGKVSLKKMTDMVWLLSDVAPPSHPHDVTDLTNVARSKYLNGAGSYHNVAIPLFSLDNTDIQANRYFMGDVYFKRTNGAKPPVRISIIAQKRYDSDVADVSYEIMDGSDASLNASVATFSYNNMKYFGINVVCLAADWQSSYFHGECSDWGSIAIRPYYRNDTSAVLNQEIKDSLVVLSSTTYPSYFPMTPYVRANGSATRYKIWHENNDGAGSDLDAGKFAGKMPFEFMQHIGLATGTDLFGWVDSLVLGTVGTFFVTSAITSNVPSVGTYFGELIRNVSSDKYIRLTRISTGAVFFARKTNSVWDATWFNSADGGNADTVDGKHASEFASASHTHVASQVMAGTLAGRVKANTAAQGTLGDAQVRDIYATTTDLTAGVTALATGTFAAVYE